MRHRLIDKMDQVVEDSDGNMWVGINLSFVTLRDGIMYGTGYVQGRKTRFYIKHSEHSYLSSIWRVAE